MTSSLHEVIEKSIDEFFQNHGYCLSTSSPKNFSEVRDFLLSSQRALLEAVINMAEEIKNHDKMMEMRGAKYARGFKKALDDLKVLLQEEIKKL